MKGAKLPNNVSRALARGTWGVRSCCCEVPAVGRAVSPQRYGMAESPRESLLCWERCGVS